MGKLLFWVAVIGAVWLAIKFAQASARRVDRSRRESHGGGERGGERGESAASGRAGASDAGRGEPIVRCAHCGLYLPVSESLSAGALHYCSAAHRDAGAKVDDR